MIKGFEGRLSTGAEPSTRAVEKISRRNVMEVPVMGRLLKVTWKLLGFRESDGKPKSSGRQSPFLSNTHEIACVSFVFKSGCQTGSSG